MWRSFPFYITYNTHQFLSFSLLSAMAGSVKYVENNDWIERQQCCRNSYYHIK